MFLNHTCTTRNTCSTLTAGGYDMSKSISVRLPKELVDRLDNLAKQTGRTKTYYIQEALLEKVSDLELVYLAQKREEDLRAGRSKTHTLDEVIEANGLADKI